MSERGVDVVFLDAGGVLVVPDDESILAGFAAAEVAVDPSRLLDAHFYGMHAVDRAQADPEVFDDYLSAYSAHLGIDERHRADVNHVLQALWRTEALWRKPLPWAADGLAAIKATGTPIVIVSNADGTVAQVLERTGLIQVGPGPGVAVLAIIDSGVVGVAKPDPAIFEIALEVAGTAADRAIHVGDGYQYDVKGARAAGIRPVLMDPLDLHPEATCERVSSLVEVAALLG